MTQLCRLMFSPLHTQVCCEFGMRGMCCSYLYSACDSCIFVLHEVQRYSVGGKLASFDCGFVMGYLPQWVSGSVCTAVAGYGVQELGALLQSQDAGWLCNNLFDFCDNHNLDGALQTAMQGPGRRY